MKISPRKGWSATKVQLISKGQITSFGNGRTKHVQYSKKIANLMACAGQYVKVGINVALRTLNRQQKRS